ncbi:MAG: TolC family protein [Sediminibacterium sp.]
MKITSLYKLLLIITLFNACKVSKNTTVPTNTVPDKYRDYSGNDSLNIANIPWKQLFVNEQLRALIDSTLNNNFDVQVTLKNKEAAQLLIKQSKLGYLPEVRLQGAGGINRPSDNSLSGLSLSQFLGKSYVEDYSVNASLSWEADIWGKIKNQQAKSLATYLQSEEARKTIQTDLIASVANGYYRLLMLDEQEEIAKKNLALADSSLSIMKLQYQSGQLNSLAIQQATAQRLQAAELIPRLTQQIRLVESYLSILSGVAPKQIIRKGNIYETIVSAALSPGIPSDLLSNRPDVKSLELELMKANANTGIAKASLYPTLSITATGGLNAFLASNWFSIPASLFISGIAGISQPVFQQGKLKTQYRLSEIEREKTVLRFRQSVLLAVGEVSDELTKIEKLKEQAIITKERVVVLQNGISNAQMLFRNGMANYLEVITAQRNVLESELALALTQKELSEAVIGLYKSLGGGWQSNK